MNNPLIQPHNQILIDEFQQRGGVVLGPYSSYTWRNDPRHILFTLARYKFCSKMLSGCQSVLEVGCGDALGAPMLLQTVAHLHCVDIESVIIEQNQLSNEYGDRLTFEALDLVNESPSGSYDAAVLIDCIEHIPPEEEKRFLRNVVQPLKDRATCIIGTPNITADHYSSWNSREGHINLKSHESLLKSLEQEFRNVFIFSMNDEVVHTGFYPMGHYLLALCMGKL